jgi:hypothetical protein
VGKELDSPKTFTKTLLFKPLFLYKIRREKRFTLLMLEETNIQ